MYKEISIAYFLKYLSELPKKTEITLFYDIETFSTNLGAEKPSFFKSYLWSLAVSYYDKNDGKLTVCLFPSFKSFLDCFKKSMSTGKVYLIAHNGNKYDHHFLRRSLIDDYDLIPYTAYSRNSIEHEYENKRQKFQGRKYLLEKRIKSKTMLELEFAINKKYRFFTMDSLPKTNLPLRVLAYKCFKAGLITEDELKTEMDYESYNFDEDISNPVEVGLKYFNEMDDKERKYIINDVVILGVASHHYSTIYPNFDFEKRTMSLNVLEQYTKDSRLSEFQMIGKYGEDFRDKIDYIKYKWNDKESLYTYLRKFYKGGLNFYNDRKIEKTINRRIFSIDLNSSYPNVMYHEKFPTFLKSVENKKDYHHQFNNKDEFILLEIHKNVMNELLEEIPSSMIKKMLVKYYSNIFSSSVYLTNVTIDLINLFSQRKVTVLPCENILTFDAYDFGGKDKIFDYYKIKSQGKSEKLMTWKSPTDYYISNVDNPNPLSHAEIDLSKLNLNTPYGIPALRKFFNVFKYKDGELVNFKNGHENSSRNLMFAVATTSYALKNLLYPLSALKSYEIDSYFYYCDTDSLYLDYAVYDKIKKNTFFDKIALGAWDVEHDNIISFWIQNHKKYCFLEKDVYHKEVKEDGRVIRDSYKRDEITIKSGGIDVEAFDVYEKFPTDYHNGEDKIKRAFTIEEFETFVTSQFCTGTKIYNNSAVLNNEETITIYKRETELSRALKYKNTFGDYLETEVLNLIKAIDSEIEGSTESTMDDSPDSKEIATFVSDEGVFIETPYQNFGMEDITRAFEEEQCEELMDVSYLIKKHEQIKEVFYWDRIIEEKK